MKPKGGRGKTLPYRQTHVRVPIPIKDKIQAIVDEYREFAYPAGSERDVEFISSEDLKSCLKLVTMFRKGYGISDASYSKPTRDNQNLKRFRDWVEKQISEGAAK
jgi:hypothetical protein